MRVLVCGGRDFADVDFLWKAMDRAFNGQFPSLVIHGAAKGADTIAADWAASHGVMTQAFPADWSTHGKSAGPIRNRQMLTDGKPDIVIAFPGGRGTADMISAARKAGIRVIEAHP